MTLVDPPGSRKAIFKSLPVQALFHIRYLILFLERKSIKKNFIIALKALQSLRFPHGNGGYF